jgi:tetratricopeptide (TPR) repeat protein
VGVGQQRLHVRSRLDHVGQLEELAKPDGAATLTNIGAVYNAVGEPQQALEYYQQALPIFREVGDRAWDAPPPVKVERPTGRISISASSPRSGLPGRI